MSFPRRTFKLVFFFGFPVQLANTLSGFEPIYGEKQPLNASWRFRGAVAMAKLGYAKHIQTLGWYENQFIEYEEDEEMIFRPWAQAMWLVHDGGLSADMVEPIVTGPSTWAHMCVMKYEMQKRGLSQDQCAVITNFYHTPRSSLFLVEAGLGGVRVLPAENFLIEWSMANNSRTPDDIVEALTALYLSRDYAYSMALENAGISDMLQGKYKVSDDPVPELKCPPLILDRGYRRPSELRAMAAA